MKKEEHIYVESESSSYKRILRSTSIIGSASVINVFVGLLRMKLAAILLGPSGVGLIGLMQSLMATASAVAAMGLAPAATRQIANANAQNDLGRVSMIRQALFLGTIALALGGATLLWAGRHVLAERVLNDVTVADTVGWLAIGVALTVASGSQGALLNGLQRIGDLARVSVGSALLSMLIGSAALLLWKDRGLIIFVITAPLASFLIGYWYIAKVPKMTVGAASFSALTQEWGKLLRLGVALMITGLMWSVAHLAVRALIKNELNGDALGCFQAGWTIGSTYLGFVLAALGTDYYPRLSAVIHDSGQANRLINEQSEVALLLAGPILVAMLGIAPWLIELLYSKDFIDAVSLLRWQVLADVLKIASWPLSYCLLASGNARAHILTESLAIGIFIGLTWILLPIVGIAAAGISFFVIFIILLPINYFLAKRATDFRWTPTVWILGLNLLVVSTVVFIAGFWSKWFGGGIGLLAAVMLGLYGVTRLAHKANIDGPVGRLMKKIKNKKLMIKIGIGRE